MYPSGQAPGPACISASTAGRRTACSTGCCKRAGPSRRCREDQSAARWPWSSLAAIPTTAPTSPPCWRRYVCHGLGPDDRVSGPITSGDKRTAPMPSEPGSDGAASDTPSLNAAAGEAARLRQAGLQATQRRGTTLQSPEAMARDRHAIRQDRPVLSSSSHPRLTSDAGVKRKAFSRKVAPGSTRSR